MSATEPTSSPIAAAANADPVLTFLFTDIEGSTRLWESAPERMRTALARHDAVLRRCIEERGGTVFKTIGDAFCAVFSRPANAVAAALAAQTALSASESSADSATSPPLSLRVRMALHRGEAEARDNDYFGTALNRVARLLAVAHGGQVLLTEAVAIAVTEAVAESYDAKSFKEYLRDLGLHRLRDLSRPERVYQANPPGAPGDFPPLRSLDNLSNNLPQQTTPLIGREREISEVKTALSDNATRLVTLTGAGGCGKSRLLLQVAAELTEKYTDGVWLAELAPLSEAGEVLQAVLAALSLPDKGEASPLQTLIRHLKPRRVLLALDNCEHLLAPCAHLAESLLRECPNLRIVASSREALSVSGETRYRVPGLSSPSEEQIAGLSALDAGRFEAIRLFGERARAASNTWVLTDTDAPAVAAICARLDGIPFALELAAARVRSLPVPAIAARLDDRFRLLTGGNRTALPRRQTLRALMDWSYEPLTESERAVLRRLSVFAGGWTLAAAEAVCADGAIVEDWDVLDLLTNLVDKSLVAYEGVDESHDSAEAENEARYRLLETVREYARERLAEAGQEETDAALGRHLDWYAALAQRLSDSGASKLGALNTVERERPNFHAAFDWAIGHGNRARDGLQIARGVAIYWRVRGFYREGLARTTKALDATIGDGDTELRAFVLNSAALFSLYMGDYADARRSMEASLAMRRAIGDRAQIVDALFNMGAVLGESGDFGGGRAALEEGLNLSVPGSREQMGLLNNLGATLVYQGDYHAAERTLQDALKLDRIFGARQEGEAVALHYLGRVALALEQLGEARERFRLCLEIYRELKHRRGSLTCFQSFALLAARENQFERAARLLGATESLRAALSVPLTQAELPEFNQALALVRENLAPDAFERAWQSGSALDLPAAVAEAIGDA